jgi:hypothetical protein
VPGFFALLDDASAALQLNASGMNTVLVAVSAGISVEAAAANLNDGQQLIQIVLRNTRLNVHESIRAREVFVIH